MEKGAAGISLRPGCTAVEPAHTLAFYTYLLEITKEFRIE
jgi:hypothetical protein